jgi:hypothetical protein
MRRKKLRWSDLSPAQKTGIVALATVEVVLTTVALVDLARRPSTEIRGRKALWLPMLFVQPVGSPLYLTVGRRNRS